MSQIQLEPQLSDGSTQGSWMVVIYNDDHTAIHDVIAILMQATGCDLQEAKIEVWEAEHFGQSSVHFGDQVTCQDVASIISQIGVKLRLNQNGDLDHPYDPRLAERGRPKLKLRPLDRHRFR